MAYELTVTPDQLAEAADVAEKLAFQKNVDAMMFGVDTFMKDAIKQMSAGHMTTRTLTFDDTDYDKKVYEEVAVRMGDAGFKVEIIKNPQYNSHDDAAMVISF